MINPVIQYTTFERLVGVLLAYRVSKKGNAPTGAMANKGGLGRSNLSDWDMFMLGAVSKLVATGGTYPYVSWCRLEGGEREREREVGCICIFVKDRQKLIRDRS